MIWRVWLVWIWYRLYNDDPAIDIRQHRIFLSARNVNNVTGTMSAQTHYHISRVSCQKGPTRHAYAWQIGPFWQDTLDIDKVIGQTNDSGKPTCVRTCAWPEPQRTSSMSVTWFLLVTNHCLNQSVLQSHANRFPASVSLTVYESLCTYNKIGHKWNRVFIGWLFGKIAVMDMKAFF